MEGKNNQTAIEAALEAQRMTREDTVFHHMVKDFVLRWGPDDPYERVEFTTDLMSLQRHMWLDTDTPNKRMLEELLKQLTHFTTGL